MATEFYQLSPNLVCQKLQTNIDVGLEAKEAARRIQENGLNALPEEKPIPILIAFLKQFTSPLVYLLLMAAIISIIFKENIDAAVIFFTLILNAVIGTYQEIKADRILIDLKNLSAPQAKVKRSGQIITIDADHLVPGDVVCLESGFRVPADGRIAEAYLLEVNESNFTGESMPIGKSAEAIKFDALIAEQKNMVFLGTTVMRGRGLMIVTKTGLLTETGQLTKTVATVKKPPTPLCIQIAGFSRTVLWVVLSCSLIIFLLGLAQNATRDAFNSAVTLAVSIIPEGLPAMITITMALGIHKMARQKALVQNIAAIDTLGQITHLVSDKTGTLTLNKFQVTSVILPTKQSFRTISVDKLEPYEPGLKNFLQTAVLASDAVGCQSPASKASASDDPLEVALLNFAQEFHEKREVIIQRMPRVFELPFESEFSYMAVFCRLNSKKSIIFVKGSPEAVLNLTDEISLAGNKIQFHKSLRKSFLAKVGERQTAGEKVIALACQIVPTASLESIKWHPQSLRKFLASHLSLLGAVSLSDPPREEAKNSVLELSRAGIKVLMATGDHPSVALSVASQVGLASKIATKKDLRERSIMQAIREKLIFARIDPTDKLKIVRSLQKQNMVVAMTGDGVNDTLALKQADIGIAMGKSGTDLAKEAADMVLLDDNISTIAAAVHSGRTIVANIQRIISYFVATNIAELTVVLIGIIIWGVTKRPVLPTQILWINLISDGIAVMPLAIEPDHDKVMENPPRGKKSPLLSPQNWRSIILSAAIIALLSLSTFAFALSSTGDLARAQTMTFTVLIFTQVFNILNNRSHRFSVFSSKLENNPWVNYSFLICIFLQVAVLTLPPLQHFLHIKPISAVETFILFLLSSLVLIAVEIQKLVCKNRV